MNTTNHVELARRELDAAVARCEVAYDVIQALKRELAAATERYLAARRARVFAAHAAYVAARAGNADPFPAGFATVTYADWLQSGRSVPCVWDALTAEQRDGFEFDDLNHPGIVWNDGPGNSPASFAVNNGRHWWADLWGGDRSSGKYEDVVAELFDSRRDTIENDG